MNSRNQIGDKLKSLRQSKKLTQGEVAEKLGMNRATISNYETNRRIPRLTELKHFAEFYGVGLDFFGVAAKDEVFSLLVKAKEVFNDPTIDKEEKEKLYREFMKLYLSIESN